MKGSVITRERVLVVEDDGFTRMLLCSQLREQGFEVVGEASTCAEGMARVKREEPDVILVDLDLGPGPNGVDLAYGARKFLPSVGIVLLSTYVDIRLIGDFRPLPTGAVFVVKRSLTDVEALKSAIRIAVDPHLAPDLKHLLVARGLPKLRDGQIEIMRLVACGYSNSEIANRRVLTEKAVAKAISRLIVQLGLTPAKEKNPRILITQAYFILITGSALVGG